VKLSENIETKLSKLPAEPGVYFHKSKKGEIIYVGKAAVLKNRVRQYFQASRNRDPKTEALVAEIYDIEWITVDSEIDALFLEAELIKRYKPRYNIALRDDKSDIFIRIDIKSDHPTVTTTHRPLDDGAEYIGSFQSAFLVRRALKYLRRAFPYDLKPNKSKRVSLDYHIGLSPGLEEGRTSLEEYRANLRKLTSYLKGSRVELVNQIEKEMKQAASVNNFESAAKLRNQLYALKELKKQIVFSDKEFIDISKDQALNGLVDLLGLKGAPYRIEGYDISHMGGMDTVASMVVFSNGIADKKEYRKFKSRIPGNNDFAHMHEVISRRFSGRNLERWPKPDLLLIDGGKGQLSSALTALKELGVEIPAIGLAKRFETIIRAHNGPKGLEFEEILLPKTSHIVKLLQRIRDESHRFAVSYHSTLKTKRQTKNILEEIPGIGPTTRRKLLRTFGSVKGLKEASKQEIENAIGKSKAEVIIKNLGI
jgi:excinuclease ABC subunit C